MKDSDKTKKVNSILRKTKNNLLKSRNAIKKIKYLQAQSYRMDKNKTWPELEFEKVLREMGIKYETQKILKGKIFDYYLPDYNTLCEVDGDYYHGNKEIFSELNEMQKRNKKNDTYKDIISKGMGYKIFRVWESELKRDKNLVIERIKNEILKQ